MAADLSVSAGTLTINADDNGGTVEVREAWGRVLIQEIDVFGQTKSSVFPKKDVNQLVFRGSSQADTFTNHTSIVDSIWGGPGADILTGGNGDSFIAGGMGNDRIYGRDGNDRISGELGDDFMEGGNGNDRYLFDTDQALGTDTIREGALMFYQGTDTLDFSRSTLAITVDLNRTGDQVINKNLKLNLGSLFSIENVIGSAGNDVIFGSGGRNVIEGRGGNDYLNGGGGNDTYVFDTDTQIGSDSVFDYSGSDTLDFSKTGRQQITVDLGRSLQSVNGNLSFGSLYGIENVIGGSLGDTIFGNDQSNHLQGEGGDDLLIGMGGDDVLEGGEGNDRLHGGSGNSTYVFAGNNLGKDTALQGPKSVTLDFGQFNSSVVIDLASQKTQSMDDGRTSLALQAASGVLNVVGSAYADIIFGNREDNILRGGPGADFIFGREGNDSLYGDAGVDTLFGEGGLDGLFGGADLDILIGGAGADRILQRAEAEDVVIGHEEQDVTVTFKSGGSAKIEGVRFTEGKFSEKEIIAVDEALRVMHHHTKNTKLLTSASGKDVTFFRHGQPTSETEISGWNTGKSIHLVNSSFRDEDWTSQVAFHEFAHYWDQPEENSTVKEFRSISTWLSSEPDVKIVSNTGNEFKKSKSGWWYYDDAKFARDYGKNSPYEDFASSFAAYFMDVSGQVYDGTGVAAIPRKIEYMDRFAESLT